ncbi:DUF188 domain-containing protein [Fictibacillus enclensis]|uniref:YaiI/YqxD family protein n=1 Tax=Fictibacillus enclensis TaxID=1017270 RepID=UPI0025A16881|nr:DUF188 domain-containing protein [Fictibacillus enclensis]MDM5338989.1 DUF188 domain-containing protein [Fictibacillus enclensis]
MLNSKVKVWVDGDACPAPIKKAIIEHCREIGVQVFFVISYAHYTDPAPGVEWVLVDSNREEVDLYVMNHSVKGDIAVTQDFGLASILVPKGVVTFHPRGFIYQEEEMEKILFERYISGKQRRAGKRTKGPSKFRESDLERFSEQFQKLLSNIEGLH